jgi:hypothetical protein
MQPYFIPYIGYFQLIDSVDHFVIADNYQFTKQSWLNRNRLLFDGSPTYYSIALKKSSDFVNISEKLISDDFDPDHLIRKFSNSYAKRPYYHQANKILLKVFSHNATSLLELNTLAIHYICDYLEIQTEIHLISQLNVDVNANRNEKIYSTCALLGAKEYVNAPGGRDIYTRDTFEARNLILKFLRPNLVEYDQGCSNFIDQLSIIDLIANLDKGEIISRHLRSYTLEF